MDDRTPPRGEWVRGVLARFERPLVRYAFALTGDLERARDVVQDTFERLLTETRELADDHLPRWLFTVCRNRAVDVTRKEAPVTALKNADIDRRESTLPGPAAQAERNALAGDLLAALHCLPADQREVVRLKFQNGLSYKEIAEITGHSVSNVGYLIHTAVRTIRKELSR
jgi:RNA polymerase sigma factor (sigma-70 family)